MRYIATTVLILLAFASTACGGRQNPAEIDSARSRLDGSSADRRCAEEEFRAAERLVEQAEAAWEARDFDDARRLAAAAELQTQRAEEAAAANPNCQDRPATVAAAAPAPEPTFRPTTDYDGSYDFQAIYFEFDGATISADSRRVLTAHAAFLREHTGVSVVIRGHCDDAGSTDYNLALGNRRSFSVQSFLRELGVDSNRMRTVSYGEEMPASADNPALNRRVDFVVR
jgi:peptidoglycan-associated lipoprotein